MSVPLRHFLVGLAFLLAGAFVGLGVRVDVAPPFATLAHVHLLLAGWVCLTIMGAMTQFVPVWSGVSLHSRRLSTLQLWLVAFGLFGFAMALFTRRSALLPLFGGMMALGFWTFAYNLGRTLATLESFDVTERHFGLALGFFALVAALGVLLAVDRAVPVLPGAFPRGNVRLAHATLALFGAVGTTVLGALYQLAPMFTQTRRRGFGRRLRRVEEVGYPVGVVLLAAGRLTGAVALGRVGGTLVAVSLLGFSVVLARHLLESRVEWTPMLSRYALVVPAAALWATLTLPVWATDPLSPSALFGAPGTAHLFVLGVVGFVVAGTLYHVVPFIVWVHRYSDLLGYEAVPMVDDLYDGRVATADLILTGAGTWLLVAVDLSSLSPTLAAVGGASVSVGVLLLVSNLLGVVREHAPDSLPRVIFGTARAEADAPVEDTAGSVDGE